MISIALLGTAALMPLPDRALTSAVLSCGGRSILFDCGEGTQIAARRHGVSLMKTDVMALTHYHGDHIFGIPGLLLTLARQGRTDPLTILGPEGLEEALDPIRKLIDPLPFALRLRECSDEPLRLCELAHGWPVGAFLGSFATEHRISSRGYVFRLERPGRFLPDKARALGVPPEQWKRLQKGSSVLLGEALITPEQVMGPPRRGLRVVFSGDTTACASLTEAARDADLLICEGTYGEDSQAELAAKYGHMTFSQAAGVAARAGARTLWLAHYSRMIADPEIYLPAARALFPNTVCGRDGMTTELHFEE